MDMKNNHNIMGKWVKRMFFKINDLLKIIFLNFSKNDLLKILKNFRLIVKEQCQKKL